MQETQARLADGRVLDMRLAKARDADSIAAEHPLPRFETLPEQPLRAYYGLKAAAYARANGSGIVLGTIDGAVAGFVFFARDLEAIGREVKSIRTPGWVAGRVLRGQLGGPRLWLAFARWARQHFASGGAEPQTGQPARDTGHIGTVHTVEAFRRLGVAKALLDVAEGELRRLGARQAVLYAATDNAAAIRLYEGRGYQKQAEVPRAGESCWLMTKGLG